MGADVARPAKVIGIVNGRAERQGRNCPDPGHRHQPPTDLRRRLHVWGRDGRVPSGVDAVIALWRALPHYRWGARVISRPGVHGPSGMIYDGLCAPILAQPGTAAGLSIRPSAIMIERTPQQERNRAVLAGPLVLFDGVCNLCSGVVGFLLPRDRTGRLYFAPIQSTTGQRVLRRHGLPLEDWDSFVFLDEGRVYLKSDAVFQIVRFLRWPWTMLRAFRVLPKPIADWLYDRGARNRYGLFWEESRVQGPR
jgi:predicted DCC family thiol-disulfide oxidoreductase YuxK